MAGFRAAYHPNPLDAKAVGTLVREEKATFLLATPTFMQTYLKRCAPEDFAGLRYPVAGAEKLRRDLFRDFQLKFGVELLEGYGCTELAPVVAINTPDYDAAHVRHKGHKPGTVGQPLPGVAVKISRPPDAGTPRHRKRGPSAGQGTQPDARIPRRSQGHADAFHGDWYVTGDLAVLDGDGFLTLTGRLTRFSKIAGEMVPHGKIEHALMDLLPDHGFAVTGVSDSRKGERLVVLHNHPSLDAEALIQGLAKAGLPNLWIPKRDAFFFVEHLPLLGSGKLDLRELNRRAQNLAMSQPIQGKAE